MEFTEGTLSMENQDRAEQSPLADPASLSEIQTFEEVSLPESPEEDLPAVPGTENPAPDGEAVTQPEESSPAAENGLSIRAECVPVINYALQRIGLGLVRELVVENGSDREYGETVLEITSEPAFLKPETLHIDRLLPGEKRKLSCAPAPDGGWLASLTERQEGFIRFSLSEGDTLLCRVEKPVSVLCYDEWSGYGINPATAASFVTPNHPSLPKLLGRVGEILGDWTGDPALDGYQAKDPDRVLKMVAAVYQTLQELELNYAVPPASFETTGQRVRLCDAVLRQKLGTCLDLTLMFASLLEAMGLHPLLIFCPGHIFVGCWLEELSFPESVQDDVSLLVKHTAEGIGEAVTVECTAVTKGETVEFARAREASGEKLSREAELIVDVYRARKSGIRPLPLRNWDGESWVVEEEAVPKATQIAAPSPLAAQVTLTPAEAEAGGRKAYWERKLLDLGLRNALISLRLSGKYVPLLAASPDELENALSAGEDFRILPCPSELKIPDDSPETLCNLNVARELLTSEFQNKRLHASLNEKPLASAVKELYRASRLALEESGANTLYLAMGLLRWYETARSPRPRYAPLILLPVELVRKSASEGYLLRLRDDEPQMNITLLEKLRQDYGIEINGLDPLPTDGQGVDTRLVFTAVRKAVMGQKNWDVLETACLGNFSFAQYVMWNDLHNRSESLEKNKVVASLVAGRLVWNAEAMTLPEKVPEDSVLLPLPADASQLYAIESAAAGQSFVLHGPPGTGKSQTITALIANALAQGKTVLFVAEKMAALEVVQKRLDKIGIGDFCLELHSTKSRKRDVLDQLKAATEVTRTVTSTEYAAMAEETAALRRELDSYARALHQVQPSGQTLYELINQYEATRGAKEIALPGPGFAASLTPEKLREAETRAERLLAAGRALGHPAGHPLSRVGCRKYSQTLRSTLSQALADYDGALKGLAVAAGELSSLLELPGGSREELMRLREIAGLLTRMLTAPAEWNSEPDLTALSGQIHRAAAHMNTAAGLAAGLTPFYHRDFLLLDGEALLAELRAAEGKNFLMKPLAMNALTRKIRPYASGSFDKSRLGEHLELLRSYRAARGAGEAEKAACAGKLASFDRGEDTDWNGLVFAFDSYCEDANRLAVLSGRPDFRLTHAGASQHSRALQAYQQAFDAAEQRRAEVNGLVALKEIPAEDFVADQRSVIADLLTYRSGLREMAAYNDAAALMEEIGLASVPEAYEGGLSHEELLPAFRKMLSTALILPAVDGDLSLSGFSGAVFDEKIREFRAADDRLTELAKKEIFCRLAARIPDFAREASQSSELGILTRAIRSGGRGMPLRKLFSQLPTLLPRLCPCMLMSPISAAQFMDPDREPFDLVVFDEASQLPTCKAVGALARGKDAVIVGDPNQMPPTSFFMTGITNEEAPEEEDLESILDDCLALNMPSTHLLWHYRSRHESLIAFSNREFYENRLYTFPSVSDRERKVTLVPLEGFFDRGKTRQNRAEAMAVVEELKRRAHDPEQSKQSVGVVTFNIMQQNLIDDLLTEEFGRDSELEAWAVSGEEPLFIKNLENVQGDERDVILFSVGYGADESGRVSMNFGPLNRDGGWRRLNVAVSRARCEMKVFSTLRPEQISLSRTSARGVEALRAFLEYASGKEYTVGERTLSRPDLEGVIASVRQALEQAGYRTEALVGRSEYRIDIGVIDPRDPDRYLLGILLDGPTYGNARTARDREVGQLSVLEGLGWKLLRVWSMDWWDDREKELKKILAAVTEAENLNAPKSGAEGPGSEETASGETAPLLESKTVTEEPPAKQPSPFIPPVLRAAFPSSALSSQELNGPGMSRIIRSRMAEILRVEAPIEEDVFLRHTVSSFDIARLTSRLRDQLRTLAEDIPHRRSTEDRHTFLWTEEQDPDTCPVLRCCGEGEDKREPREVTRTERVNALVYVLETQLGLPMEELIREAGHALGYARITSNVTDAMAAAAAWAKDSGLIREGTGGLTVLTEAGAEQARKVLEALPVE